ncbi:hypothetical protein E4Z66_05255 [Aliishimia ponticola]|uniref:Uncharacterized protein n=1 Tax=Aliishimia ponticola TaxID=2499833 RepID=A0A4S4NH20_9RHOB|nr:hypothetical protein [Aliishimia ponticola]THH38966.1 hypothetical protein E4Z66_05255 [Aliishimia ponticola]
MYRPPLLLALALSLGACDASAPLASRSGAGIEPVPQPAPIGLAQALDSRVSPLFAQCLTFVTKGRSPSSEGFAVAGYNIAHTDRSLQYKQKVQHPDARKPVALVMGVTAEPERACALRVGLPSQQNALGRFALAHTKAAGFDTAGQDMRQDILLTNGSDRLVLKAWTSKTDSFLTLTQAKPAP